VGCYRSSGVREGPCNRSTTRDGGRAEPDDLNDIAWHALLVGKVENSDVEDVLKGVQLSNSNPSTMHTLGCVYAEIGKTKEAREVLVQAMDSLNLVEPDDNYWYAFGRIAEQYGEYESAKGDYGQSASPSSRWTFIRRRIVWRRCGSRRWRAR
jgi:hypothetical protein